VCSEVFRDRLEAIILTGSLARNEATIITGTNSWSLLGDADFLLVLRKHAPKIDDAALRNAAAAIEARLERAGGAAVIGLGSVSNSYFHSLPAHGFTYELKNCGKVIWGNESTLDRIPSYSAGELSKEDAWRTLCHRMIELLISTEDTSLREGRVTFAVAYATLKLYLDIATSYLIFVGHYQATYQAREQALRELSTFFGSDAPFDLKEFSACLSRCTEWKLRGLPAQELEWTFTERAIAYALQLWFWEAAQLGSAYSDCRIDTLVRLAASRQTAIQRVRGWASLLRRSGWIESWRNWPRWARLSVAATPRYLIYEVATQLFTHLPSFLQNRRHLSDVDWNELRRKLPQISPAPPNRPVGWRTLVGDLRRNYKEYLYGTYA
jgi:hypothetical protein